MINLNNFPIYKFNTNPYTSSVKKKKNVPCANIDLKPAGISFMGHKYYSTCSYTSDETKSAIDDVLKKHGKINLNDYYTLKISPTNAFNAIKQMTINSIDLYDLYTDPRISGIVALSCKKYFDSLYGKDGYTVVSIGTSPSFMTEPMSALGCDVKFIPISEAAKCTDCGNISNYFERYPNLKYTAKYLKNSGINSTHPDDKKILLLDYYCTGRTLKLVNKIITEYCKVNPDKIVTYNISKLLKNISTDPQYNDLFVKHSVNVGQIIADIDTQAIEFTSNVPHFDVVSDKMNMKIANSISSSKKQKEDIFKEFDNFSKKTARAYQLCVLDAIASIQKKQ